MRVDIGTQAIFDATINDTRPKLLGRGWREETAVNVYDANGNLEDVRRIYRNDIKPGAIFINENARTIEFTTDIPYEEAYWFAKIGMCGGFDNE